MRRRALSDRARSRILQAAPNQLLIGGQALGWWAVRLQVDPGSEFPDGVTFDFDFLASPQQAQEMHRILGGDLYIASRDEATSQTAKIFFRDFEGDGPVEIDFLASMVGGLEAKARERAVGVEIEGHRFFVLHPFDVLRTRVANLHVLRDRTHNPRYIAQARLAGRVLRGYLEQALHDDQERLVLKVVEALVELAESAAGVALWKLHGLDVMGAVPADQISSVAFRNRRWPQLLRHLAGKRSRAGK